MVVRCLKSARWQLKSKERCIAIKMQSEVANITANLVKRRACCWPMFFFLAVLYVAGGALADIRKTPHSLTKNSVKPDASDVCVFCHTPDISANLTDVMASPIKSPVWQKSVDTKQEFTIYDDIGRVGLGRLSVGSQSIACLSCHDGTQAPSIISGGANHPFGVPYRGAIKSTVTSFISNAKSGSADSSIPFVAAQKLVALEDFRDVSQGTIENRLVFWVSQSGITQRRTRSDLPVYARQSSETESVVPYIECSSCHDPHSENALFLRTSQAGSNLCLTCHIK